MNKGAMSMEGIKLVEGDDGELHIEVPMHQGEKRNVPEYYGFTSGRYTRPYNYFQNICSDMLEVSFSRLVQRCSALVISSTCR